MSRYIVVRILQGFVTIFAVVTVVFFLLRMAPGDPAYNLVGQYATPEQLEAVRAAWGLDRPLLAQYFTYLGNILRGDFGESFVWSQPAVSVVMARLPNTVYLALAATLLTALISIPVGILAAVRRGGIFDALANFWTILAQSMPDFWVGIMLVFLVALHWRLLPTSGFERPTSIILPALTVALFQIALVSRVLRGNLVQVLASQYIMVARAKGLGGQIVLWRHALKNAAIPVATVLGTRLAGMLNGVVVVEAVFSWPGLGATAISALEKRDYPLIQAVVIITAAMTIGLNLLVDLAYTRLDPRVRLGKAA